MQRPTLVFDLNGTLLDMSALDSHFQRIFGDAGLRQAWFQQMQLLWMTTIALETFEKFEALARAALRMLAASRSVRLEKADESMVVAQMAHLPGFADVPEGLRQLRAAGHRLVVLTNGARKTAKAQVKFAGIAAALDDVFAVDEVKWYKPAPQPYRFVAKQLKCKPKDLLMVAAHAWDLQGARQVGFKTAFIARQGEVLNPLMKKPEYVAADLIALAQQVIAG